MALQKKKKIKLLTKIKSQLFSYSSKDPFAYIYLAIFYYIAKNILCFVNIEANLLDYFAFFLLNTQQRPQRKQWNLPEFSEVTSNMQTAEFMLFE